jgi:hypothetical protein
MGFLLLAILWSASLPLLLRAFDDWWVNLFWAIPANYFACMAVSVSSLLAMILFRERLSKLKKLGVVVGLWPLRCSIGKAAFWLRLACA